MAYDQQSIARSIRRYLGLYVVPGPPWDVQLERVEVRDDARPAGVLEVGEETSSHARETIWQGEVENVMPVSLALYPALAEPAAAGAVSRRLASSLRAVWQHGLEARSDPSLRFADDKPACGPSRIPLWDYDGIADNGAGPVHPHDVLWLEDWSVRTLQDPMDARRWTVASDLRVSYEAPGRVPPGAVIVRKLSPKFQPPP